MLAALLAGTASAKDQPPHVYGAEPSWSEYRELAEAALRQRLVDPDSAKISWIDGYRKGGYKPFLSARVEGYTACGEVNARNRMGGYAGAEPFVVVIDYGRVLFVDMANQPTDLLAEGCRKMREQGGFPPLGDMPGYAATKTVLAAAVTPPSPSVTATGLGLQPMPDGAYVASVASGSPAATAGVKPGMVIGAVNGITLASMGDAMVKVIDAAGPVAKLTIIGGSSITLGGGGR